LHFLKEKQSFNVFNCWSFETTIHHHYKGIEFFW
jgi:hypothetical protein